MKIIPSEAWKIASLTKKSLVLSDIQKQLIVGTLLGDGTLEKNGRYHRLKVQQSVNQKEYVLWKYGILKNWVISEPHYQAVNRSLRFRTVSHPILSDLRSQFYRDGVKIVPDNVEEFLEKPLVLATWFMDDGNAIIRKGKLSGWHINSHSFTEMENKKLAQILKNIYSLSVALESNHKKQRIRINKSSYLLFMKAIKDSVIDSMQYKLG